MITTFWKLNCKVNPSRHCHKSTLSVLAKITPQTFLKSYKYTLITLWPPSHTKKFHIIISLIKESVYIDQPHTSQNQGLLTLPTHNKRHFKLHDPTNPKLYSITRIESTWQGQHSAAVTRSQAI